jgi:uncharacterized coiled-coil DUF342 family protein
MNIEFESTPEYRKKHTHFYDAINILLQDPTAKININSVTKQVGYNRSSIRKDRDEWTPLLKDIEIANNYQLKKPHFVAKAAIEKNKEINANVKEYKEKYLNILSAFYDLSRIVNEQSKTIKHLESEISEKNKIIARLEQEIHHLNSNGKVTHLSSAKNKK